MKFLDDEDYLMSREDFVNRCKANFEYGETMTDEFEMNIENAWQQYKRG